MADQAKDKKEGKGSAAEMPEAEAATDVAAAPDGVQPTIDERAGGAVAPDAIGEPTAPDALDEQRPV